MNSLDLYILAPILVGFVIGLLRGFVKEIIAIIIIIIGIYLSRLLSLAVANWLAAGFDISIRASQPIAFIIIFIVVAITLTIIGRIVQKMIQVLSLGCFNALLGGVFGALKLALLVSLFLIIGDALNDKFNMISQDTKISSKLYQPIKHLAPTLWKEYKGNEELKIKN